MIKGGLTLLDVSDVRSYRTYHIIAISIVVFPICLLRSVNSLRYATFVSIGAIFYTAVLLVIEMPFFWDGKGKLEFFKIGWDFFSAFGITFFAFTCQPGFYSALDKLSKRDESHKVKVAYRSCCINLAFYIIIILSGYLSSYDQTPDIIIDRPGPESFKIPVFISQLLIACALCVSIPLNYVPLRTAIYNQAFGTTEYTFNRYLSSNKQ